MGIDDTARSTGPGQRIRAAWADHLGQANTHADTNFFRAGGNSLLATAMLGQLSEELGCSLTVGLLARNPTLGGLSTAIGDLLARQAAGPPDRP